SGDAGIGVRVAGPPRWRDARTTPRPHRRTCSTAKDCQMATKSARKHAPGTKKKTSKRLVRAASNGSLNGHAPAKAGKMVYFFGKGKTEGSVGMKDVLGGKG